MTTDFSFMTVPFQNLNEYPINYTLRPTLATVRELDARVADGEISFFFSRGNYEVDLTSYPGGLDGLLRDVRDDAVPMNDTIGLKPQPPIPPLALKNREWCYVIYRLVPTKNWQFAEKHAPFSVGINGNAKSCHFEARRIDSQGNRDQVVGEHPPKDDCIVAYFISDGRKATGFTGEYQHAVNIHVDLLYGGGSKGRMPIILDPDVRFPGGSGL